MQSSTGLELRPRHWCSRHYEVSECGNIVGHLHVPSRSRGGSLSIGGDAYSLARVSSGKWEVICETQNSVLAQSHPMRLSGCLSAVAVEIDGSCYELSLADQLGRLAILVQLGAGIGWVYRGRQLSRAVTASLPTGLPTWARVFIAWLALVLWQQEDELLAASTVILMGS